jgi:histone-lysine N-methyltransferase SETD3
LNAIASRVAYGTPQIFSKMTSLTELLKQHGAIGIEHAQVSEFEIGRGLQARKSFSNSESILSVPIQFCWKAQDILDHPILSQINELLEIRSDDALAILLMYAKVKPSQDSIRDKIWKEHLKGIPNAYTNSIFLTEAELDWARGSSLSVINGLLQSQIQNDFNELVVIMSKYPNVFPLELFTFTLYKWALCTIWSRAMDFAIPQPNGTTQTLRTIVPFADFINGSLSVDQCHQYNPYTGMVEILAGKEYQRNDQIFINYGSISNARLLRLYGFVFENNPNDAYELFLATDPQSPDFDEKQRLFQLNGMNHQTSFLLTDKDPLPEKVLVYLRIQRASKDQLTKFNGTMIDQENETIIFLALKEAFEDIISSFYSERDLRTQKETQGSRNCAIVALGELLILKKALAVVKERLSL